jgi:chromosome condensin MukBEF ATPase and DNA-binding subunit MukB
MNKEEQMKDKIKARLEELQAERTKAIKEIQEQAEHILAPFNAAIAELEALIKEDEPKVEEK